MNDDKYVIIGKDKKMGFLYRFNHNLDFWKRKLDSMQEGVIYINRYNMGSIDNLRKRDIIKIKK